MLRLLLVCATWLLMVPMSLSAHAEDAPPPPLAVVDNLNLNRLYGRYYEIGTYLQWMEQGCKNSVLTFSEREPSNTVGLTLECDRGWFHPKVHGEAVPIDPNVLARTIATFHPPMGDTYREEFDIIKVDSDYNWVVVGHPKRHLLWVLSRTAAMPTESLVAILDSLHQDFGYTNVRKNLSCTEHKRVKPELCANALDPRAWFDDYIQY